jgi:hypothetical protein
MPSPNLLFCVVVRVAAGTAGAPTQDGRGSANDIKSCGFPYPQAKRIFSETIHDYRNGVLPMSEEEFRSTPNPVAVANNRHTRRS